jgi:hypothetical protein
MTEGVTGFRELDEKLADLKGKQAFRVIKSAMLSSSKVLQEKVSANAAALGGSGALAQSIGRRFVADSQENVGRKFHVYVGPRTKQKTAIALHNLAYRRTVKGIFYGHLVEKGFTHRSGGAVGEKPFLLPALRATQSQVIAEFKDALGRGIENMVKRNQRSGIAGAARKISKSASRVGRKIKRVSKRAVRATKRVRKRVTSTLKRATKRGLRR